MVRLIEIFHWMFADKRWRGEIVFQGLILLVPVVGVVALLGWMTAICERLTSGRHDAVVAGFHRSPSAWCTPRRWWPAWPPGGPDPAHNGC
jgi:hypothetical protein